MPAEDRLALDIQTEGYAVVRNLFSAAEIARLRGVLADHFATRGVRLAAGRVQPNAAIEVPALAWLYSSAEVVALFRRALGTDDIVFTGHCDIHCDIRSGWHKDSGNGPGDYFRGDYFAAPQCKVYKMAIYLQDHVGDGSGLNVDPRSHHTAACKPAAPLALDTAAGDVVLFDVRLSHSGQRPNAFERFLQLAGKPARLLRHTDRNPILSDIHHRTLKAGVRNRRFSIFFTFGFPNAFTDDFARGNMRRQVRQTHTSDRVMPAALFEGLARAGVRHAAVLERPNDPGRTLPS